LCGASQHGIRLARSIECCEKVVEKLRRHHGGGLVLTDNAVRLLLDGSTGELADRLVHKFSGAFDERLAVRADPKLKTS